MHMVWLGFSPPPQKKKTWLWLGNMMVWLDIPVLDATNMAGNCPEASLKTHTNMAGGD